MSFSANVRSVSNSATQNEKKITRKRRYTLCPPKEEEPKTHWEEPLILFLEKTLSADATESLMPYLLSLMVLPDTSASKDSSTAIPASSLSWTLLSFPFQRDKKQKQKTVRVSTRVFRKYPLNKSRKLASHDGKKKRVHDH